MPFREKSAWISLVCLVATFGYFFLGVSVGRQPWHGFNTFARFFGVVVAFIVLQVALRVVAAAITPKDAKAPPDERERLILFKSGRNAHAILLASAVILPVGVHLGWPAPVLAYHLVLAVVVSEIVRSISQIVYFRVGR